MGMKICVEDLASAMTLGAALTLIRDVGGSYDLSGHWQQGEFHHDVVLRLEPLDMIAALGGETLIITTNCNGGIKEVMVFDEEPDRWALWHSRCPENPEFSGTTVHPVCFARTMHWFDPCELLAPNARSELREEFRQRQRGGGWGPTDVAKPEGKKEA